MIVGNISGTWNRWPLPVRCFVGAAAVGFVIGLAIAVVSVIAFLNVDPAAYPPREESLEAGTIYAMVLGFPAAMALEWMFLLGLSGWILFMLVAPALNLGLFGLLVGALVVGARRTRTNSR